MEILVIPFAIALVVVAILIAAGISSSIKSFLNKK